jgi:hypothetical protein
MIPITKKILFNSLLFFTLYLLSFVLIRQYSPSEIIFYQGLFTIFLVTIIFLVILFINIKCNQINKFIYDYYVISILLGILLSYSFLITIPSLLDRSISLYMIGLTQERKKESILQYREDFYNGFIVKNGAIEKRIREQIVTGNFECFEDQCSLTKKGKIYYLINSKLVQIFNIDSSYIIPNIK